MTTDLYTLQLEPHDDAVSIRERLTFIDARRVLLMWPPGVRLLRRQLDLLLVQRQAARLGMRIALVTDDWDVIEAARDLNISVFPDEQSAAQGHWQRPRDTVFAPPRDPHVQADLVEHIARRRQPLTAAGRRWRRIGRWALFAGLVLVMGLGLLIAAPSATVTLTPASRQVHETVTIIADPALTDIDIENRQIPASVVSLEATSRVTIQTSGKETAGASLAQGLVTFTNLTGQAIVIPLGTIVATSGTYPVQFETLVETTLPAGDQGQVQVPIQALNDYSGPAGNVNPNTIHRVESDLNAWVTVINPNGTYGGSITERHFVTAEDQDRLVVLGRQQVLQRARDTLLLQLADDQFLVPGSVAILDERPEWTVYSAIVGDTTDSITLDFRARVQAVVVDEQQAEEIAYTALAPYVRPGLEIAPGALSFTRGDITQIEPSGRVTFLMTVSGSIAVSIDAQQVRERVTGVSRREAYRRLDHDFLLDPERPARISTWPGWYHRLPLVGVRITVHVETP
jgi:hypothetical protein